MKTNSIDMNDNKMFEELGITNASPFKTPDGYFEGLTARVMKNIPNTEASVEKEAQVIKLEPRKRTKTFFRWTAAAAACFLLVFTGVQYWNQSANDGLVANNTSAWEEYDDEYAEEMLSYTGMDETDVYNYLSGTEY